VGSEEEGGKVCPREESMTYQDQLKDPRWQRLRLEIMTRDHWRCRLCHTNKHTLNVHHIQYTTSTPWDEPLENLITTCCHCHEVIKHCKTDEQLASFRMILAGTSFLGQMLANGWDFSDDEVTAIFVPATGRNHFYNSHPDFYRHAGFEPPPPWADPDTAEARPGIVP
jgi:hypothetical protein